MVPGLRDKARSLADGQGYFLILLVLSVVSWFVFPAPVLLNAPVTWCGLLFIGSGIILAIRCRTLFLQNRTTLSPYVSPTVLMTTGPFRFSRNPVYLSMAFLLLGSAVLMGTLVPFVFVVLFVVIIEVLFIPDEELVLEERFGEEYREYKREVRRWM